MSELAPRSTDAPPLESSSLLRAAHDAGFELSSRTLETLRAQNLLPAPIRTGNRGRVPLWVYPEGTDTQLVSLLRWRELTKDPDTLTALLWLNGFPIPLSRVRESLTGYLQTALHTISREINSQAERLGLDASLPEDRRTAVSAIARQLAGRRGPKAPPRRTRVTASDRHHAFELVMRAFALGEDVQATEPEARGVERALGMAPNGRHDQIAGTGPWLDGPATDLFDAAEIVAIPNALRAVGEATDAELEAARGIVLTLVRYLPLLARASEALFDKDNYAGFGGLRDFDQNPELAVFLVPCVVSMLRTSWQEHLSQITDTLNGLAEVSAQATQVLDMPHKIVAANLRDQPPQTQAAAQRLINAATNGELNPAEFGPPPR